MCNPQDLEVLAEELSAMATAIEAPSVPARPAPPPPAGGDGEESEEEDSLDDISEITRDGTILASDPPRPMYVDNDARQVFLLLHRGGTNGTWSAYKDCHVNQCLFIHPI